MTPATLSTVIATSASVLLPELEHHRRTGEVEGLPHAVLEIALEVVISQARVIGEEREARRLDARLGTVLQAERGALLGDGVSDLPDLGQELVDAARRDLARVGGVDGVDGREQLLDASARERGDTEHRRVSDEPELARKVVLD